jgi:ectoine hydroxylase-related dioxygenase (phytanoyl-CoA dioxygenase family)
MFQRILSKLALRRGRPGFRSRHGGLWTDRSDALKLVDRDERKRQITSDEAEQLRFWIKNGYLILQGAVNDLVIDRLLDELDRRWRASDDSIRVEIGGNLHPLSPDLRVRRYKLLDYYAHSQIALQAAFADKIRHFLQLIFERELLLFQSLSFEWGSGDPVHQDTAYVVVTSPLEFAAAWIALEDIQPGSGELTYYAGSHRMSEHEFGGHYRNWNRERDGIDKRKAYLDGLHDRAAEMGLSREVFLPKKGDALIWAADLAHGGTEIENPKLTRKSLVCHYCPRDVDPYYFARQPERRSTVEYREGCHYASLHYALGPPVSTE